MRRSIPRLSLRVLAIAALLLLSACGGSGSSLQQDGGASSSTAGPGGGAVGGGSGGSGGSGGGGGSSSFARYELANGCMTLLNTGSGQYLLAEPDGSLSFTADTPQSATSFFLKASGLGRYLFYSADERFMSMASGNESAGGAAGGGAGAVGDQITGLGDLAAILGPNNPIENAGNDAGGGVSDGGGALEDQINANRSFQMTDDPNDGSEWEVDLASAASEQDFTIVSFVTGEQLGVITEDGVDTTFRFVEGGPACTPYPEAQLNATGTPFSGTNPDGTVFGYAETHMHLGGSEALGGRLSYGRPFHRFGISHALGNCEEDHGPDGSAGALDSAVDPNTTVPNHDTVGWPTFNDWPTWGSQTHHQTYYIWIKRAWMGGLRFMVNHLVANEMLCNVWPVKGNDCNEMTNARLQYDLVLELQDYIDAQEGGPGRGFFRIVTSPAEARAVIEEGKLAVINGTEMEKVFDCGEFLDSPECSEQQIDERLAQWYDMGLRAIFPIHIFDNAFGGAEIARFTNDPPIMNLYNQGNFVETGHYYATVPCSQAEAIEHGQAETEDRDIFGLLALQASNGALIFGGPGITGCQNNARGLTSRGEYFINRLIDYGIIIETDHTGPLARKRMLDIALERGAPVVSGHTGSISHSRDSKRILEVGGVISILSDDPAPVTIEFFTDLEAAYLEVFGNTTNLGSGFGADINGIHKQPKPRDDAADNPLIYPFTSYDGNVVFERQVTGERVFDHNIDGVAHYGLYPDYIADIQLMPGSDKTLEYLFKSAEAYLRAWEQAESVSNRP